MLHFTMNQSILISELKINLEILIKIKVEKQRFTIPSTTLNIIDFSRKSCHHVLIKSPTFIPFKLSNQLPYIQNKHLLFLLFLIKNSIDDF